MKTIYPEMTDSEKQIADFILGNPERIYNLNIQLLAKILKISSPTVFRFAQKLGFKGFKDFKVEIVKDMAVEFNLATGGEIEENASVANIAKNIFEKIISSLNETLSLINFDELLKATEAINLAKRLLFFAVSSSLSVAYDSYFNFLRAGFNCFFDMDSYIQRIISTQCGKKDVAIGISFSGESIEVVDCLKNAKEEGATTICVTTFTNSSITKFSDIKLFTAPVRYEFQKIDLPSKKAQTALLDVMYLNAVLKNRDKAFKNISKSEEELLRFRKPFKL